MSASRRRKLRVFLRGFALLSAPALLSIACAQVPAGPLTEGDAMAAQRERMVERDIAGRGIGDPRVLAAMREVPRHRFVDPRHAYEAYGDHPLPIAGGQTISQPYIVALMLQAAELKPGDRVLEIGAGSGYAAAVISRIAGRVFAIERHPELSRLAADRRSAVLVTSTTRRFGIARHDDLLVDRMHSALFEQHRHRLVHFVAYDAAHEPPAIVRHGLLVSFFAHPLGRQLAFPEDRLQPRRIPAMPSTRARFRGSASNSAARSILALASRAPIAATMRAITTVVTK